MNNSERQRKIILEGNIPKVVSHMAVPSIILQIVGLIYNTVDTYFIAQIDKSAAAAVGTVFAIQSIIQAIGFGFGMGVSSLCSRKLGEAADSEAEKYASSGVFAAALISGIFGMLALLFLEPILRMIGCTDTMLDYGRDYAVVILLFAPVSCICYVVGNIFKAEGHLKYNMYGNVAGALINVVMDPVFIFVLDMGTMGAALATALSQVISLIIYFSLFARNKTVMRIGFRKVSRSLGTYIQIVTTGLPTFFRQGLGALATALLCKQGANFGDATVAAVTISNKCYMLVRNIVLGLGQGTQPVAGYNYGAGKFRRTREVFAFAIKVGTVFCCISAIILYIFATDVMWWFCKDAEVLQFGVPALRYACMVLPVMAFSTFVNQTYQFLGFKKQATFLASCRQGVFFIPIILLLPGAIGVTGVELAQPMSDALTCLISIPFFISIMRLLANDKPEDKYV